MRGVVSLDEAQALADEAGLDLVEVSPQNDPPVCKILDYGKYRYEAQKKAKEAKKKQKVIHIKEIKVRPNIDTHDYEVKLKQARKFIEAEDKVKVTLRFRGREMSHQDLGLAVLKRVAEDMKDIAKTEMEPKLEGRQMMMILVPA
jgi:translation initiation factor IF-3